MKLSIKYLLVTPVIILIGLTTFGQELTNTIARNIKIGNTQQLEPLTSPELINACVGIGDSKKYNYLTMSIKLKSMTSLIYFVENGADIEKVCADKTPLMYAAKYGQLEMVKFLVEKGADINATYRGKKAYDYARHFNHHDIRRYLKDQKKSINK